MREKKIDLFLSESCGFDLVEDIGTFNNGCCRSDGLFWFAFSNFFGSYES